MEQINMLDEEIKKEISIQLEKKLVQNSIEKIILNSQYFCLGWGGLADGVTPLVPGFDVNVFNNKNILVKAIHIIPYTDDPVIDISFSDGTTETIPTNMRVNRVFDTFLDTGVFGEHFIRILFNGTPVIFATPIDEGCPPPNFLIDNIYYWFKEPLQQIQIIYLNEISSDLSVTTIEPIVKIFIECYLF